MLDHKGYRLNVGIILVNSDNNVFLGKRKWPKDTWQFPQGGIENFETPEEAMLRELQEEVGLEPQDVQILGVTRRWLYYKLPPKLRRYHQKPLCIGQKQKWFLLRLVASEEKLRFDMTQSPEFIDWQWVDYWQPLEKVIHFKRDVYQQALQALKPLLHKEME